MTDGNRDGNLDDDLDDEFARIVAGWDREAPQRPLPTVALPTEAGPPVPEPGSNGGPNGGSVGPTARTAPGDPTSGPSADPTGIGAGSGLSIPISPSVAHTWRASSGPAENVDEVLDAAFPEDAHFVPPTITDLPTSEDDPTYWAILVLIVGGILLLLYVVIFDRGGSPWWPVTALISIITGFVMLVLRGGSERDPFDDGTRV